MYALLEEALYIELLNTVEKCYKFPIAHSTLLHYSCWFLLMNKVVTSYVLQNASCVLLPEYLVNNRSKKINHCS